MSDAQIKAHTDAIERHNRKAAEHRLAVGAYLKGTPEAVTHAQAEWRAVCDERMKLQRRGIHTSTAPADVATWAAHCERHHAAREALPGVDP